jgi:hypothetical protein
MFFWWLVDVLMLRRLDLGRPFRYLLIVLFLGCLIAGVIYTVVFLNAAMERRNVPHVHSHHTH